MTCFDLLGLPIVSGQIFGGPEKRGENIVLGLSAMRTDGDVCRLGCHYGDWRCMSGLIYLSFQMVAKAWRPVCVGMCVCKCGWMRVCTCDLHVKACAVQDRC